ncbi:MAG: cation:proton antiporter, partial [Polaromonas sp.]|nr:cation:proton antiporter [Polaromonas sp.]
MTALNALTALTEALMPHLMLVPILLPLLAAALMLLLREERQRLKLALNLGAACLGLLASITLLLWADRPDAVPDVYLAGNWRAPYGIALVLDRLSALMLVLTSIVALATALFSAARWHRAGVHFHPLFQLQ